MIECPDCGGSAELVFSPRLDNDYWHMRCKNCGKESRDHPYQSDALKDWKLETNIREGKGMRRKIRAVIMIHSGIRYLYIYVNGAMIAIREIAEGERITIEDSFGEYKIATKETVYYVDEFKLEGDTDGCVKDLSKEGKE